MAYNSRHDTLRLYFRLETLLLIFIIISATEKSSCRIYKSEFFLIQKKVLIFPKIEKCFLKRSGAGPAGCWDKRSNAPYFCFFCQNSQNFINFFEPSKEVKNLFTYLMLISHTISTRKNQQLSFAPSDCVYFGGGPWEGVHNVPSPT